MFVCLRLIQQGIHLVRWVFTRNYNICLRGRNWRCVSWSTSATCKWLVFFLFAVESCLLIYDFWICMFVKTSYCFTCCFAIVWMKSQCANPNPEEDVEDVEEAQDVFATQEIPDAIWWFLCNMLSCTFIIAMMQPSSERLVWRREFWVLDITAEEIFALVIPFTRIGWPNWSCNLVVVCCNFKIIFMCILVSKGVILVVNSFLLHVRRFGYCAD